MSVIYDGFFVFMCHMAVAVECGVVQGVSERAKRDVVHATCS